MKRLILALAGGLSLLATSAADVENLWPEEGKIPHFSKRQIGVLGNPLAVEGGMTRYMPSLEWWPAPAASNHTGTCAILVSGGAYKMLGDKGLVENWGRQLTALGVQCVTLVYRTGRPDNLPIYQSAWEDGQRAVRLVRAAAQKRGFDPNRIGVFGMSAGSHLATLLATSSLTPAYAKVDALDDQPCNVNWACTCAIAYGMTDGLEHSNSRMGILNAKLDPLFKFDKATCPMWMSHGGADPFSPNTSIEVYKRLRAMKIPAELELYPDQGHGAHGLDHAYQFLRQRGLLAKLPAEELHAKSFLLDNWHKSEERVELWPPKVLPEAAEGQFRPYLEWHMPVTKNWRREATVIFLAGSNTIDTVSGYDPSPLRRQINRESQVVVTVHYRTTDAKGAPNLFAARCDARRALKLVRSEAEKRGFDPELIGVLGVGAPSADVALFAASTARNPLYRMRPADEVEKFSAQANWAAAVSPSQCFRDDLAFDFDTPPILLMHGDGDGAAVETSLAQWELMRRRGIQGKFVSIVDAPADFFLKGAPGTYRYGWTKGYFETVDVVRERRWRAAREKAEKEKKAKAEKEQAEARKTVRPN